MKLRSAGILALALFLQSCGSITLPAAVKMEDGTALVGTTTAAASGGKFEVATSNRSLICNGTYDAFDTSPSIIVPVVCTDGQSGTASITRTPNGMAGYGIATLSSGQKGVVGFGSRAAEILSSPSTQAGLRYPAAPSSLSSTYGITQSALGVTGNCPTPDSIAADGKRCGARSAASRPGGFTGYGYTPYRSYSKSSYVRGHFRNGSYVRGHYRRR